MIFSFKEDEVKIAIISKSFNSLKLKKVYTFSPKLEYLNGLMSFNNEENVSRIKSFMLDNKITSSSADVILSIDGIITRQIEAPLVGKRDLDDFIRNNIEEYFTVNIKEYAIDYQVISIEKAEVKKMNILLAAIPESRLKDISNLLDNCKVASKKIKIYPQCIANLFNNMSTSSTAVIDLGTRKSNVTILDKGRIFLSSNMTLEAYEDKDEYYDELFENLEYFLNFYSSRHFGNKVEAIHIIGKLYKDDEIVRRIEEHFDIKVTTGVNRRTSIFIDKGVDRSVHGEIIGSIAKGRLIYGKELDFGKKLPQEGGANLITNTNWICISLAIMIFLEVLTSTVYFALTNKKYDVVKINKEMWKLEPIEKEINDLTQQKKDLQAKTEFIKKMDEEKFQYMSLIDVVEKALPIGVTIRNISVDRENVTVTFNINNSTLNVARLAMNLNDSNAFEPIDIKEVKLDDTVTEINFTLKVKKVNKGV